MKSALRYCVIGLLAVTLGESQQGGTGTAPMRQDMPPPPNMSTERALQWNHEQNLEDTSRLVKLAQELKWDLANHDREVLSVATVKKMDEIERLIRRIRSRVGKK